MQSKPRRDSSHTDCYILGSTDVGLLAETANAIVYFQY